jgi:hypothetical protein
MAPDRQIMKTEAIKNFLMRVTHRDLAERYHFAMETQVIVAQDRGERVEGEFRGKAWTGYTDGVQTWKPIRIPWNAATEPEYTDSPMTWSLEEHAAGIGMTGWNWQDRESLWLSYDFDSIIGHADSHAGKLTDQELKEVREAACAIPWVTTRRSTGGSGLHLTVFLDGVRTDNHCEHQALARSVLGKMSGLTGFDFRCKVDVCGSNFWIWHRKMKGTQGLELLKAGEILYDVPPNWRDHVQVVKGSRRKTMPTLIEASPVPGIEKLFDDLTSQRTNTNLDPEHLKLIAFLEDSKALHWWDADRQMLVCHTWDLKQAHTELQLRGIFETIAAGTERGNDYNSYMFPMRLGAWSVRRFTPGVQEHASWTQDGAGWTTTFLNREPGLAASARTSGGMEGTRGGYVFPQASLAMEAAAQMGVTIDLPIWAQQKRTELRPHKDGRLIVRMEHEPQQDSTSGGIPGWGIEGKFWTRIYHARLKPPAEVEVGNYDDLVRHLITENVNCGWTIKTDGEWVEESLAHVKDGLKGAHGFGPKEVVTIVGSAIFRNWKIVNRPFAPEYPGDRQWNRNAAQFKYHPTENRDDLQYPTWTRILKHCGAGLDDAIKEHAWCRTHGIVDGGDYLKVWIASMFQFPLSPLPYLFFYSAEQNTGKSIFHESITELLTCGVARADNALTSTSNFNGELASAVLCVVEETDLSRSKVAYSRIKDWVTSRNLPIHAKGLTPYTVPNSSHWCITGDTWVFTSEGPRQARDLVGRPTTVRFNGRSYPTEGFFSTGRKEVFEVETVEGYKVRATADHQFLVNFGLLTLDQRVDQLTPGSLLCLCDHTQPEFEGQGTWEDGYLVGWMIGDGTIMRRSKRTDYDCRLYFCDAKERMIPWVADLFPEYPQIRQEEGRFVVTSPYLEELRVAYGLDERKAVNGHIESASSDFQRALLSGLFDCDAHIANHTAGIVFTQSDLPRMEAVQRMLLNLGIVGETRHSDKSRGFAPGKRQWYLAIRKSNLDRFQSVIGFNHPDKWPVLDKVVSYRNSLKQLKRENFLVRMKSVTSVGFHDTFDVMVPEVHHFSANGFAAHNCQASNDFRACPIFQGDTRITMVHVKPLKPEDLIPKEALLEMLRKEASDFLAEVLGLEIPPSGDRLNLPVIVTGEKLNAQRFNETRLESFLSERCFGVDGRMIRLGEFVEKFHEWLDAQDVHEWSKRKVGKELPPHYPKGRSPKDNQVYIGNIDWEPRMPGEAVLKKLVLTEKGFLVTVK